MMQLATLLTLLAMTWMSGTNARIGDGGHRNLVNDSKLKECDPNQNPTYTPECLSEGKGYTCTNVNLGSRNGDYRCVDKSQSSPTIAPTPADITEDECDVLTGKATGYSLCKLTRTCLAPGDDTCKEADCEQNSGSTGYSWCKLTHTCLAPSDDACKKAECEQNSGSTGYVWCVFNRSCIAPSATCEAQTCKSTSDCPPTTTCMTMYGGPSRCAQ